MGRIFTFFLRVLWANLLLFGCAAAAVPIAPGTYFFEGEASPNRQPDGNSVVLDAPGGLIVFHTGRHPEHILQLIEFARTQHQPVAAIINSHWHLDHVGGNARLRSEFPEIRVYASSAIQAARKGFLADYRNQLQTEILKSAGKPEEPSLRAEVALIDAGAALEPTDVITQSSTLKIAGRALQVHLESHAVTAGDVWVFDAKTRVLLAGDLVTLPAPLFESACPARWKSALAHLQREPFDWLVPGHGAPMHSEGLSTYAKAFSNLLDCAASDAGKTVCIEGWVSDASVLLAESRDVSYARTLIDYYLENYLRHPSERIVKFCTD